MLRMVDKPQRQSSTSNKQQTTRTTLLMYACSQGDLQQVQHILHAQPSSVIDRDRTNKTALHYCAGGEVANANLAHCADLLVMAAPSLVDATDQDGYTPLHLAVIAGNMQLVHFLLANGADVNALDAEKHSVVHWATVCGETAALNAVLSANALVSTPDVHGGYPLHYAAQMCGSEKEQLGLEVLRTLLQQSHINVTVEDNNGRQPLLWAASAGSAHAVLALIRAGAQVEASDRDGLTALHCAASRGHTDCIDTLLTLCGATTDTIDCNGCTALHYSVTLGHADATALLLNHGTDPNRQDRKGRTPAHCGCAKGQLETMKLLGAHGAKLWLKNARGDLPLHEAAASGRRELVKWLLDQRPSQVNARNNDGRCPLHLAAFNDNVDMCKILLDLGAQVNPILRTSKNVFMTPLDCAFLRGFRSTAKFLQLHGGLPASRLAVTNNNHIQITTASSASKHVLRIKEDVTVIDGSSSSDLQDEDVVEKSATVKKKRKSLRRRVASRYDRERKSIKNQSVSGSELESGKLSGNISKKDEESQTVFKQIEIKSDGEQFLKKQPDLEVVRNVDQQIIKEVVKIPETISNKIENDKEDLIKNDEKENEILTVGQTEEIKTEHISLAKKPKPEQNILTSGPILDQTQEQVISNKSQEQIFQSLTNENLEQVNLEPQLDVGIENGGEDKMAKSESFQQPDEISIQSKLSDESPSKTIVVEASVHQVPADVFTSEKNEENEVNLSVSEVKNDKAEIEEKEDKEQKDETNEDVNDESKKKLIVTSEEIKEITEIKNENEIEENNIQIKQQKPNELSIDLSLKKFEETAQLQEKANKIIKDHQNETMLKTTKKYRKKLKPSSKKKLETTIVNEIEKLKLSKEASSSLDSSSDDNSDTESVKKGTSTPHKSFKVLQEDVAFQVLKDDATNSLGKNQNRIKRKTSTKVKPNLNESTTSSPEIQEEEASVTLPILSETGKHQRSESNLSAPNFSSAYNDSDNEQKSASNSELDDVVSNNVAGTEAAVNKKRRFKKRTKLLRLGSKSAGSDYESSNLIDSGFEPSPRSSRIPKRKVMSERGVDMTTVTQSIQSNIRRYQMERKIFQHLLDLKRLQIRSGQSNESVLVKRAIDAYHKSIAVTVGAGRYTKKDFSYKSFEQFLYHSLRMLQKSPDVGNLKDLPQTIDDPLLCTQSTHRCLHATHAYTGVPCAAYLPQMNHHTIPKIGFTSASTRTSSRGGFLPQIHPKHGRKQSVMLELCHGSEKQVISLPADRLDQNKRYYVTFTVKGQEPTTVGGVNEPETLPQHRHAKSV